MMNLEGEKMGKNRDGVTQRGGKGEERQKGRKYGR